MPKSNRCGECEKPIKGHVRRSHKMTGQIIARVRKIKSKGNRRPATTR